MGFPLFSFCRIWDGEKGRVQPWKLPPTVWEIKMSLQIPFQALPVMRKH